MSAHTAEPPPRASVLVVDDHPANLLALEGILEPLGLRVVKAGSGEEALARLLEEEFAAILMDVQMPGLDGLETAKLVKSREKSRHIPIIFITAISRETAYVFRGYQTGAVDYMLKPLDPEILRAKVSVFVDLHQKTEQVKRQEAALREREREVLNRESEHRYRELTDSIPHGVLAANAAGEVSFANRTWSDFTGLDAAASAGLGFVAAVAEEEREGLRGAWLEAVAAGRKLEVQVRLRRASDGALRWHLARAAPERDRSGALVGWIATATDIHERLEAEAALRDAIATKDRFFAAASHELRTPLTSAKLQVEVVRRAMNGAEPKLARSVEVVAKQIDRMIRLVESMLDVTKLESGQLSLDVAPFDLAPLLEEVRALMQTLTTKHEIRLEAPERLPLAGDRHRLDQVFTNIISNAIRYSPDGGPIEIAARAEGGEAVVAVRDRGLGIPPGKEGLIFEPFKQAHGLTYGGLGLGLTIARSIVERHGGRIEVESGEREQGGTTFRVRLPLGHEAPARVPDRPPRAPPEASARA